MSEEKNIYLVVCTDAEGKETERLVSAAKPTEAIGHVVGVRRAKPEDVARVMGAGGKIEEAGA